MDLRENILVFPGCLPDRRESVEKELIVGVKFVCFSEDELDRSPIPIQLLQELNISRLES